MYLEFRHDVKGLWGYHNINEICFCSGEDEISKGLREFRKDKTSVLWLIDVSKFETNDTNYIADVSLEWESWQDYMDKIVKVNIWCGASRNVKFPFRLQWESGKKVFRKIARLSMDGNVKRTEVRIKERRVY